MKVKILSIVYLTFMSLLLSSCMYPMPEEDDLATIPLTNNPSMVNQKGADVMPTMSY